MSRCPPLLLRAALLAACVAALPLLVNCAPPANPLHRQIGGGEVSEASLAPSARMDAIEELLRDGLYEDARSALQQAVDDGFAHPRAFHLLGEISHNQGRHEESLSWLQLAIDQAPHWPEPRLVQANAYLALQRPAAAEQIFAGLALQFPNHPAGPYGRGWIALMRNQLADAARSFEEALSRDNSFAPAIAGRAQVAGLENNRNLEQQLLTRYRILRPLDPYGHFRIAELEQEQELYESARKGFERAYSLRPNPRTARSLADLAVIRGNTAEAEKWQGLSR